MPAQASSSTQSLTFSPTHLLNAHPLDVDDDIQDDVDDISDYHRPDGISVSDDQVNR